MLAGLLLVFVCLSTSIATAAATTHTQPTASNPPAPTCTIAAAGDIAYAGGQMAQTAALVKQAHPQHVLVLGDAAQGVGETQEFTKYYQPTWGAFKSITKPTPGNHDYATNRGAAYYAFFNVPKYYTSDICGWRLYSLNSEEPAEEQIAWARNEAKQHPSDRVIVMWHRPRWSSGMGHSDTAPTTQPLWDLALELKARIVLHGHDHHYERFAPLNAQGQKAEQGPRVFIVGTGGIEARNLFFRTSATESLVTDSFGVLLLQLRDTGFSWRFQAIDGTEKDSGEQTLPAARGTKSSATPPIQEDTVTLARKTVSRRQLLALAGFFGVALFAIIITRYVRHRMRRRMRHERRL